MLSDFWNILKWTEQYKQQFPSKFSDIENVGFWGSLFCHVIAVNVKLCNCNLITLLLAVQVSLKGLHYLVFPDDDSVGAGP